VEMTEEAALIWLRLYKN